jgi:hypothetical protein
MSTSLINSIRSNPRTNNHRAGDKQISESQTIVLGKFSIETSILEFVESKFERTYPFLIAGIDYSWQDILGQNFWFPWDNFPIHLASICLEHIATKSDSKLSKSQNSNFADTLFQIC